MTSGARYSAVPQNVDVVSSCAGGAQSLPASLFIQWGVAAVGVPAVKSPRKLDGVGGAVRGAFLRGNSFERPKSVRTMCPSAAMRMFSGLRSR